MCLLQVGVHDMRSGSNNSRRRSSGVVLTRESQQRTSLIQQQRFSTRLCDSEKSAMSSPGSSKNMSNGAASEHEPDEAHGAAASGFNENAASIFQSFHGGIPSAEDAREIYFLGIIDILQLYNMNKRTESAMKGMFTDKCVSTMLFFLQRERVSHAFSACLCFLH